MIEGVKTGSVIVFLTARAQPLTALVELLSREFQMPISDRTGLQGNFDFKLEWSIEGDKNDIESALFAALQSQLGLKLESRKMPIDLIVVDKAERPSEN